MSQHVSEHLSQHLIETKSGAQLEPLQVRIQEAARLLGYDERTIRRLVGRGELRAIGRGRLRRIAIADLRAWQERNRY
jgi:excisionase family DNA binding protein